MNENYKIFYINALNDIEKAKKIREYGLVMKNHPNWFDASYISWLSYDSLNIELPDGHLFFAPIVNWGRYREENGRFHTRKELLKVPKLGPKAFLQCAGFLRIPGGEEPLDNTSVHPESYEAAAKLLKDLGYTSESIRNGGLSAISSQIKNEKATAEGLGIGEMTLHDIVEELEKPGRDPRSEMPKPVLRTDVLEMKDLKEGMVLKGTVRNVIDFGAFVDIGVHQDGLVHISQMTERYIKHPLEVVSVGDIVDVQVMSVDLNKKRIQLTMKIDHSK